MEECEAECIAQREMSLIRLSFDGAQEPLMVARMQHFVHQRDEKGGHTRGSIDPHGDDTVDLGRVIG